jgi:hypothetical protein
MSTPNTQSATPIQQAGRSSRGVPHGLDQSLFWKDVRQAVLFVALFTALGGGVVLFLLLDRPAQAMVAYSALVVWCLVMIVAGLRRGARR